MLDDLNRFEPIIGSTSDWLANTVVKLLDGLQLIVSSSSHIQLVPLMSVVGTVSRDTHTLPHSYNNEW